MSMMKMYLLISQYWSIEDVCLIRIWLFLTIYTFQGKKDSESENKLEEQAKSKRNLKKRPESIELDCDEDKCGKESQNTSKKTRSRINNLTNKVNRNSKALEKKADSENETTVNRNKKKQSKRKVTLFKNNSSKKVKHDEKCEKVKTSEDANSSGKEVVAVMQESSDTETESVEYEVEKLVDVYFKKKGQREFLVRWKGYSSKEDTWEPEKNLNCKILIENFLKKCEQVLIWIIICLLW